METRTRDLLFGTGRGSGDLRGTFAPRGWGAAAEREKGSVLATFRGIGPNGWGRDKGLELMERAGMITSEQRAAGGAVESAAGGRGALGLVGNVGAGGAGTAATIAGGQAVEYANPVYGGLYAQMLMRDHGFVPPLAPAVAEPEALRVIEDAAPVADAVVDGPSGAIADAAAAQVDELAQQERALVDAFQRMSQLPEETKLPTLARALDATSAAGHGPDSIGVLAEAIASRPMDAATSAINGAVDDTLRSIAEAAAPVVATDAAKVAAPVVDDIVKAAVPAAEATVAHVVEAAVPKVVEAAVPKVVEAVVPSLLHAASSSPSLLVGATDALHGVMPFAAGVEDTLRLLSRVR